MKTLILLCVLSLGLLGRAVGATPAPIVLTGRNSSFLVKMTSTMSAATSKPGDRITAVIINPVPLRGGRVEGVVDRADHAILHFRFTALQFAGQTVTFDSELVGVVSSKGNAGQDDLGQRVRLDGGGIIAYGRTTAIEEGAEIRFVAWQ